MTSTQQGTGGLAAQQMPLIHRIFRRELRDLERLVHQVPASGGRRASHVADHLGFLLDGLRYHHSTEDELIWPVLEERVGADAALLARMTEQHADIDGAVGAVRAAAEVWRRRPGRDTAGDLASRIRELRNVLEPHLDEEERVAVPLIDAHLTRAEWDDVGEKGFEKFTPKERPIAIGQLLEVATAEEARLMFADLPLPVRVLWRVTGKRQYRRYIAKVRGKELPPVLQRAAGKVNALAVRLYRRSSGRIGGSAKGIQVLLVTVRGRRTGAPRTTPVAYFDLDGGYLVCGSGGGMATEPQWFRNLRRADRAEVRVGDDFRDVTVRVPDSPERDRIWEEIVLARAPFFAKYEQKSDRIIPIAYLTPA